MVLAQDVTICDRHIKKKPENVLVAFPSLESYVVVTSKLVAMVNTPHAFVVLEDTLGTWNGSRSAISHSSVDC